MGEALLMASLTSFIVSRTSVQNAEEDYSMESDVPKGNSNVSTALIKSSNQREIEKTNKILALLFIWIDRANSTWCWTVYASQKLWLGKSTYSTNVFNVCFINFILPSLTDNMPLKCNIWARKRRMRAPGREEVCGTSSNVGSPVLQVQTLPLSTWNGLPK